MAVYIRNQGQFNKQLLSLRRAGKKAAIAASYAEKIIQRLAAAPDGEKLPAQVHKLTPRGEDRIEACGKFDLGSGYRLLFRQKGGCIVFLFIGTHDECDLWIKNHRGLRPEDNKGAFRVVVEGTGEQEDGDEGPEPELEEDDDDGLMERIDEKTLRKVFCGLFRRP